MTKTRRAVLAGTWYESDPTRLADSMERWVAEAGEASPGAPPVLLLVPHAGHQYSGAVAAAGFHQLRDQGIRRIVLLAPSHRIPFDGVALPPVDVERLETPLGEVAVDTGWVRELAGHGEPFVTLEDALTREHAIEVELPFVAGLLKGVTVVPLVCGHLDREGMKAAGQALFEHLDDETVMVVSSDLTHYGTDYGFAPFGPGSRDVMSRIRDLDHQGLRYLVSGDPKGWLDYRRRTGWTACGATPAAVGMWGLPEGSWGEIVRYTTSAEVSGDFERSVSYAAALVRSEMPRIPKAARATLHAVAMQAIREAAGLPTVEAFTDAEHFDAPILQLPRAAFVTIYVDGELRGCIGRTATDLPLLEAVRHAATSAAISDPRFTPIDRREIDRVKLDISVLSPLRRIESVDEVRIGVHGLEVEWRGRRGLLLPQVASRSGIDPAEFLDRTLLKAGIDPPLPDDAVVHVFAATVF